MGVSTVDAPAGPLALTGAARRILEELAAGEVTDRSGQAVAVLRDRSGLRGDRAAGAEVARLQAFGLVAWDRNHSRTYAIAITSAGREALVMPPG